MAARLGGDEFAILISDEPSLDRAIAIAHRLIEVLGTTFPVRGHEVDVGVSIGIVMNHGPNQTADDLLSNADVAMYTAKARGGDASPSSIRPCTRPSSPATSSPAS